MRWSFLYRYSCSSSSFNFNSDSAHLFSSVSPPRRVSIDNCDLLFSLCLSERDRIYKLIMSVQPTAGVKTGDEFVDNVASGDGEEMTPHPHPEGPTSGESMRALLMGKPNRNSVRNMNSLVRSGVGHPRSRYHLDMSASNEDEEGEEDGGTDGSDADDASPKKKKSCCTSFCGVMDDHFLAFVIGSAAIGMAIGIGLAFWNPENYADKATAILWIGLLGDLFIRALKCIILPLVFVSIAVSVMDMVSCSWDWDIQIHCL